MTESSGYHPQAAEPVVTPRSNAHAFSPSLPISPLSPIWFVPLIGVLIGLWLTYWHYSTQGLLITITFDSAEGIEASKTGRASTPIKYLDVEMGRVEEIEIDPNSPRQVIIKARMLTHARDYLNDGTKFWVVRPHIGLSGISGLRTLVSGSYIEMSGAIAGGETKVSFKGLEHPPLTPSGAPGLRIGLHATKASAVERGSPVFYRGIKVGTVESRRLSKDGVKFGAFIEAPYHDFIDANTRFWNAGGINVTVGTEGLTIHSESVEALILGGVAFSNPFPAANGSKVEPGRMFPLYKTRVQAEIQPVEGARERLGYVLYFDESLRGLKVGAPVEYRGIEIGYVADIHIRHDARASFFEMPKMPVTIFIKPNMDDIKGSSADRVKEDLDIGQIKESLFAAVEKNRLRARLQTANLFTGALFIELAQVPGAKPARIGDGSPYEKPYPVFPTVPSSLSKITALFNKLDKLPLEELITSASGLFDNADAFIGTPTASGVSLRELMDTMKSTLKGIDAIIGSPENGKLPVNLADSLRQLKKTLQSAEGLFQGNTALSPLSYEFSAALHEVTHAARAVRLLTETLESKPESLLFGK
ncbi:MAG: paraquat-inducible protein B [Candidatus Kentron sp. G]|nr:MAG: paraquat-inducible protein B [Candidatus Kentron sp. G]VFM96799.1 MAG: paraquat-inducible protein B [Candidatus Kentron sp. G]VFM98861.1 MAG: paraquat-inducible protein B [Candidatus Kentron sp. G]